MKNNSKQLSSVVLFVFSVALFLLMLCISLYITKDERFDKAHSEAVEYLAQGNIENSIKSLQTAFAIKPDSAKIKGALSYFNRYIADSAEADYDKIQQYRHAFQGIVSFDAASMTEDNGIFSYFDSDGNLILKLEYTSPHMPQNACFLYDAENNIIATNGDAQNTFAFNQDGKITEEIVFNGKSYDVYNYCYDDNGQIETVSFSKCDFNPYYTNYTPNLYYTDYYKDGKKVKTWHERDNASSVKRTDYYNDDEQVIKSVYGENEDGRYIMYYYTQQENQLTAEAHHYYSDGYRYKVTTTVTQGDVKSKEITEYYERDGSWVYTSAREDDKTTVTRAVDNIINPRPLTKEEIDRANTEGKTLIYFMGSAFDGPADLDVNSLLYRVADKTNVLSRTDLTEWQTLEKEGVSLYYHYMLIDNDKAYRIPAQKVKNLVEKYLGIPMDDIVNKALSKYSKTYDCYYVNVISQTDKTEFLGGVAGDNFIHLYTKDRTVVLEKQGDNYYIHSVLYQSHTDLLPLEQQQKENEKYTSPNADKVAKVREVFIPYDRTKSAYYNKVMKAYNDHIDSVEPDGILEDGNYTHGYSLYDLTGDGIPELIEEYMYGVMVVWFYHNGQLESLDTPYGGGGDGGKSILPNGVLQGWLHKIAYQYQNICSYNADGSVNRTEWGAYYNYDTQSYDYKFNDKIVDIETFVHLLDNCWKEYGLDNTDATADIEYITTVDYIDPPQ